MTTCTTIKEAIARSISHNETVRVEISSDFLEALSEVNDAWKGEIDYTCKDHEGSTRVDAWGWNDETPANKTAFRLELVAV